jgi:peptide/nickel transport system substrate-binding protein
LAHKGLGTVGEHHHVSPIHPEYAKLPALQRDVAKAKKLLADAGYPNGIDAEIACKPDPSVELLAVQAMVEQWKDAGIRVKINVMPSTQFWEVWTKVPFERVRRRLSAPGARWIGRGGPTSGGPSVGGGCLDKIEPTG